MSDEIAGLSAGEAARLIASGSLRSEDYVAACLGRVAAMDTVGAFAHLDAGHALAQARALDEHRLEGRPLGPLHGIPVGIKDIIDTADYPTECGSRAMVGRQPTQDAAVVSRLRAAGAVIFGKTVTTEVAYRFPARPVTDHDPERTPGGSSSGSAAAVAASMLPLAVGSQTAGSVIRPGLVLRRVRHEADPRPHRPQRRDAALPQARPPRRLRAQPRRHRARAQSSGRARSGRSNSRPFAAPGFLQTLADMPPAQPNFAFVRTPMWDKADAEAREAFDELVTVLGDCVRVVDLPAFGGGLGSPPHRHDGRHGASPRRAWWRAAARPTASPCAGKAPREVPAVAYLGALEDARRYAESLSDVFPLLRRHHHARRPRRRPRRASISPATRSSTRCGRWWACRRSRCRSCAARAACPSACRSSAP